MISQRVLVIKEYDKDSVKKYSAVLLSKTMDVFLVSAL